MPTLWPSLNYPTDTFSLYKTKNYVEAAVRGGNDWLASCAVHSARCSLPATAAGEKTRLLQVLVSFTTESGNG